MYVDLHNHSQYSFLDGLSDMDEMIARAKELGMSALAITDHGTMHSYIEFYMKCKEAGIKPIIGCEVYVTRDNTIKDIATLNKLAAEDASWLPYASVNEKKKKGQPDVVWGRGCHLVLLAKNEEGLKNLYKIVSNANTDGFYYKPLTDMAHLERYGNGIIAMSACIAGEIPQLILKDHLEEAKELAIVYKQLFDDFYLELQPSQLPDQLKVNAGLIQIGYETGIKLVCTSDSHYVKAEDWEVHEILLAMQTKTTMADPNRFRFPDRVYYLHSEQEMLDAGMPQEAIDSTAAIAEMCNVEIQLDVICAPVFPDTRNSTKDLEDICYGALTNLMLEGGLTLEGGFDIETYQARLKYELEVIKSKNLCDYFLIVKDFIDNARARGIFVGPGRGSGAGCLVSYLCGITRLDPIKMGLFFERFLNPERMSYPDIDTDFEQERRGEVLEYINTKYGRERVCHVGTIAKLGPKLVVKDVGRVLGMDYDVVDRITKIIPSIPNKTLKYFLENDEGDKRLTQAREEYPRLFELALRFEQMPRQTGVAASGIIISPVPLTDAFPVMRGKSDGGEDGDEDDESGAGEDVIIAQLDTPTLEHLGLIKFDVLGLRTLSVIKHTLRSVRHLIGDIDIWDANKADGYSDPQTYAMISSGNTDGIFQLESYGMRKVIKDMKPKDFAAIVALVALYRPGPMDLIPDYVARYRGDQPPQYVVPEAEEALRETYGVTIYQEQVMALAMRLAGYTPGSADLLRKAMGKKKEKIMKEQKAILVYGNKRTPEEIANNDREIPGFVKLGMDEQIALDLADAIGKFSGYAFNKAHAASYAVVTYATAWLKAHFPRYYMAAQLSSIMLGGGKKNNLAQYINNIRSQGYRVVQPDVNLSTLDFSVEDNAIRFGLLAIRDFGESVRDILIDNRPYASLEDFVSKVCVKSEENCYILSTKPIRALILSGALDSISPGMTRLDIYNYINSRKKLDSDKAQPGEIILGKERVLLTAEGSLALLEERYLGVPMALDPLNRYSDDPVLGNAPFRKEVTIHGVVQEFHKIKDKQQKDMAFVKIRFSDGIKSATIFENELAMYEKHLVVNAMCKFTLFKSFFRNEESYTIRKIAKAS